MGPILGVMADVRWYKDATPITIRWPLGGCVQLRPLPLAAIQAADVGAATHPKGARWMARAASIISCAISPSITPDELLDILSPPQLAALAICQMLAQERATIDTGLLQEWVRKSVNDHGEVLDEAALAYHSDSASEFYGRPTRDLTTAQLCWFLSLQQALEEFHIGVQLANGKRKKKTPSGPWLRRDRKERLQWQIDC